MPPRPDDHEPTSAATRRASRVPPHDLQAEESLLGAMMLSAEAIADAAGVVTASDFYKPAHGHVYDAVHTLYAAGPAGRRGHRRRRAAARRAARRHRRPRRPRPDHVVHAGDHQRRPLRRGSSRSTPCSGGSSGWRARSPSSATPCPRTSARPSTAPSRSSTRSTSGASPTARRSCPSLLSENLDRLEQLYERGDAITGTPTGYLDLDELLSGLQPSSLVVVGARPAMGKTSFALGMVAHAALEAPTRRRSSSSRSR